MYFHVLQTGPWTNLAVIALCCALTFAPLDWLEGSPPSGSLWAMMRRRYESYKDAIVRPFYREHIARLDRQIVLVDTLTALNAGPDAINDLERAL
ncbi:MAG: YcjX family protein, partial [Bdellovibrionaceae bacterium]|nr:YcjX family protein [Pseudobdellovibrionaceae bacterium]